MTNMNNFDYQAPAELFARPRHGARSRPITYRRFDSGAEAIQFAIEKLTADVLRGTVVESDEERYEAEQIRALYDSESYPLNRRALA
jgi:hypothetical protein